MVLLSPPTGWQGWEAQLLLHLHGTATPTLDQWALRLTGWGTRWGTLPIAAIGVLLWTGQRQWRKLAYWVGTIGGTSLVAAILKVLWQRPRPELWPSLLPPDRYPADWSFPSGHATASLALVAALWILCPVVISPRLRWVATWVIGLLGGSFALVIAWTRLYLGLHFVTDILGGWSLALGGAIALARWLPASTPISHPQSHREDAAG
jgi:undecaprenyl-diphosphatase